jgi:hypothetical protein
MKYIILALACFASNSMAGIDQVKIIYANASKHYSLHGQDRNNHNKGGGLEIWTSQGVWQAGHFIDSYYKPSDYLGYTIIHIKGDNYSVGTSFMMFKSPSYQRLTGQTISPIVLPYFEVIISQGVQLNLTYKPKLTPDDLPVLGIQVKLRM